jgi:hypothetical protein
LINQANAGPSNQETMVLTLQQAPTTMFLDADDLLAPTYIDSCIANLERDKI